MLGVEIASYGSSSFNGREISEVVSLSAKMTRHNPMVITLENATIPRTRKATRSLSVELINCRRRGAQIRPLIIQTVVVKVVGLNSIRNIKQQAVQLDSPICQRIAGSHVERAGFFVPCGVPSSAPTLRNWQVRSRNQRFENLASFTTQENGRHLSANFKSVFHRANSSMGGY